MTPFPGESLPLEYAVNYSGTALDPNWGGEDILKREAPYDYGSDSFMSKPTVTAGDAFNVWVYGGAFRYLEPDTVAIVTWCVEVLGGSGVLRLRDGVTSDYDGPVTPPNSQGTVSVSGAGSYVWTATATTADLLDYQYPYALIEGVSGAVQVQQVKLRVWPPGGPLGALSDVTYPGSYREASAIIYSGFWGANATNATPTTDFDTAWNEAFSAAADIASSGPTPGMAGADGAFGPGGIDVTTEFQGLGSLDFGTGNITIFANTPTMYRWYVRQYFGNSQGYVPDEVGTEGVDWIVDPYEVWRDDVAWDHPTAPATRSWLDPQVDAYGLKRSEDQPETFTLVNITRGPQPYGTPLKWPEVGADITSLSISSDLAAATVATPISLPNDANTIRLEMYSQFRGNVPPTMGNAVFGGWVSGDEAHLAIYTAGTRDPGAGQQGNLRHLTSYAPFRVWVPTARRDYPMRLKQRGDGLGMGSGRVLGVGTRQGGIRVFGSY